MKITSWLLMILLLLAWLPRVGCEGCNEKSPTEPSSLCSYLF